MTLKDIKLGIQSKELPDTFMIFVCPDNNFIANSYIDAICEVKQLEKTISDSIFEQSSALSLVMAFENNFRVVYVENFVEMAEDYSQFVNTAVICKSIDKKLVKLLADYTIQVPALQEWQIKSYMSNRCPSLTEADINDLYSAANGDIYRIQTDLDKICLFPPNEQGAIAIQLVHEVGTHLYDLTNFQLVDAIVKKDVLALEKYLKYVKLSGNEFLGIVSLVLNKVKAILFAEYSTKSWQELGISEKQFYHMQKYRTGIPMAILQQKLKVLTELDLQLKSGLLDISNSRQIDYLILKLVN